MDGEIRRGCDEMNDAAQSVDFLRVGSSAVGVGDVGGVRNEVDDDRAGAGIELSCGEKDTQFIDQGTEIGVISPCTRAAGTDLHPGSEVKSDGPVATAEAGMDAGVRVGIAGGGSAGFVDALVEKIGLADHSCIRCELKFWSD